MKTKTHHQISDVRALVICGFSSKRKPADELFESRDANNVGYGCVLLDSNLEQSIDYNLTRTLTAGCEEISRLADTL
jgi:hypothetical protein